MKTKETLYLARLHLDHKVYVKDAALSTIDLSQGQRNGWRFSCLFGRSPDLRFWMNGRPTRTPSFENIFYHEIIPELQARAKP